MHEDTCMYEVLSLGSCVLPCLLSLLPKACAQPSWEESLAWHKPSLVKQQPEGWISRQTLEGWCKVAVSSVSSCPNSARAEAHGQAKPGPKSTCVRQACCTTYDLKALVPKEFESKNQSHHRTMPILPISNSVGGVSRMHSSLPLVACQCCGCLL